MRRLIPLHEVERLAGQEIGVSDWHVVSQEQINLLTRQHGVMVRG